MLLDEQLSWILSLCDTCRHRQKARGIMSYFLLGTPIPYAWEPCALNKILTCHLNLSLEPFVEKEIISIIILANYFQKESLTGILQRNCHIPYKTT